MGRNVSVDDLVLSCQQQVALENHTVIERPEWLRHISRAYGELWTITFESGLQYFETSQQFTTDGTLNYLAEPSNLLSLVGVSFIEDAASGAFADLRALQPQERSRASRLVGPWGAARFYAHVDDRIYLYPKPLVNQVYEVRYVPQSPDLMTFDGDMCVDVVTPDGHDFLIWGVAVRVSGKTEAEAMLFASERNDARKRFAESVRQRALTAPRRLIVEDDVMTSDEDLW